MNLDYLLPCWSVPICTWKVNGLTLSLRYSSELLTLAYNVV